MAASIKTAYVVYPAPQNEAQAQPGWFAKAAAAAKDKENLRTARNVGIGAALGTAGVLLYQHFAG